MKAGYDFTSLLINCNSVCYRDLLIIDQVKLPLHLTHWYSFVCLCVDTQLRTDACTNHYEIRVCTRKPNDVFYFLWRSL